MNITAGFLLLFLNVFLPGMLFLRFYFKGEHSKQFSTKVPTFQLALSSAIPGIIIQLIGLGVYNVYDQNFSVIKMLEVYNALSSQGVKTSFESKYFLNHQIRLYTTYTILTLVGAIGSGFFFHQLVRVLRLDHKFKIFRFQNIWSYVFSGEITSFSKHRNLFKKLGISSPNTKKQEFMLTKADVLIETNSGTELYSGYVVDYDLSEGQKTTLNRIYLLDALRYKKKSDSTETRSIPGSLFALNVDRLVNINLTYIPTEIARQEKKSNNSKKAELINLGVGIAAFIFILWGVNLIFTEAFPKIGITWFKQELNFLQCSWFSFTLLYSVIVLSTIRKVDKATRKENIKSWCLFIAICLLIIGLEMLF